MKILIVDDNLNNRMILKLLLEEYAEVKNISFEIQECENGLIAVNKTKREKFDLVFMDIMMPEMDGIEATKKIRHNQKDLMIIAVSAVDDEIKQKEILRNGAEDYVPKPIDSEQLFGRLDNYIPLLNARHHGHLSEHRKASNLYTKNIFYRQTIFYVTSEEALAEFWEYYLLRDTDSKMDGLSDVVRAVFAVGEAILKLNGEPWIIVEGDAKSIYFTINQVDTIGSFAMKLIMKKNSEVKEFKQDDEKLTVKIDLKTSKKEEKIEPKEEKIETVPVQEVEISTTNTNDYVVFDYMDPDDMAEVEETLGELSSLMLILGNSNIDASEIADISAHLDKLNRIISIYTEAYTIGKALSELSIGIREHSVHFQEMAADLSTLSAAFSADLGQWYKMTFHDGAPSVDFMNATIVANVQTICAMLSDDGSVDEDANMDDIFDF